MQRIIERLNSMIALESSANMTLEQEHYVAGLADALKVVEERLAKELVIGNTYYAIMFKDNEPYVKELKLYRINKKKRKVYCFTRNINYISSSPTPDLVLTSEHSLKARIFNSREEAEKGIKFLL